MRIEGLAFDGFRNLKAGELCPGDGVNILYGDNGQGKTNLLEAIWLFTGGRSFRGAKDAEMVGLGLGRASLRLRFFAENREQEAEIAIQKRRIVRLNGSRSLPLPAWRAVSARWYFPRPISRSSKTARKGGGVSWTPHTARCAPAISQRWRSFPAALPSAMRC